MPRWPQAGSTRAASAPTCRPSSRCRSSDVSPTVQDGGWSVLPSVTGDAAADPNRSGLLTRRSLPRLSPTLCLLGGLRLSALLGQRNFWCLRPPFWPARAHRHENRVLPEFRCLGHFYLRPEPGELAERCHPGDHVGRLDLMVRSERVDRGQIGFVVESQAHLEGGRLRQRDGDSVAAALPG